MKKILFVYPTMMIGGSTTALLSFLNNLDPSKYQVDLQLFTNDGPLFDDIPQYINVLPEAQKYVGRIGRLIKKIRFIIQGGVFKAVFVGIKNKKCGLAPSVIIEFQAKHLSRKTKKRYDYAIGYLEGWSNNYLAYNVNSNKKYAWLHSTFTNITKHPETQLPWMKKVDNIVFVTDACTEDFKKVLPSMADKAITIANITDSDIIRKRGEQSDDQDEFYKRFIDAKCFKIITVCRLTLMVKGLDRIVRCARALKEQNKEFLWYIVGGGSDDKILLDMIKKEGLDRHIVLVGPRFNPYPFIQAADIMCMPSRYEGKPVVITESMILGTPPVVTEYLSAREQIQDGVDGIVVDNTDDAIIAPIIKCEADRVMVANMRSYLLTHEYGNKKYVERIEKNLFE